MFIKNLDYFYFKNIFDRIFSFVFLLLSLPICIIISLLVLASSPGPIIYKHKRIGLFGKSIICYKFRTMVFFNQINLDDFLKKNIHLKKEFNEKFKLKKDPRITNFGRFLRKTSLDELPQLLNVIRGDMSLIGPRPITKSEREKYGSHINKLHSIKPGISGLWQVSGRSRLSYKERVQIDIKYINNVNFFLDLKIFIKTLFVILRFNSEEAI